MPKKKRKPIRAPLIAAAPLPENEVLSAVPAAPNRALREVREATRMTQAEFADALGVSAPYVQAVELGQRKASSDLARRVQYKTGAWPLSIEEGWEQAVDSFGEPYTNETYQRFRSPPEDAVTDDQIAEFVEPLASLALAAAKKGKLNLLGSLACDRLLDIMHRLHLEEALKEVLKKKNAPVAKKITVGELRSNPVTAGLLGYKDDPTKRDGDVLTLQGTFEEQAFTPEAWFPILPWYPRAEEIRRKYEVRRARQGEVGKPTENQVSLPAKKTP